MKTTKQLIGKDEAKIAIGKTRINRKLNKNKVLTMVEDIKNNRWIEDSGETIKFDKEGNLIDGQHRLHAIIQSDTKMNMYIQTDVDMEAQKVIDGGNRNLNDMFMIMEVEHHPHVTTLVKGLYAYDKEKLYNSDTGGDNGIRTNKPSNLEYKNYYEANQKIIDGIVTDLKKIVYMSNAIRINPPSKLLIAGAIIIKKGGDYEKVLEFLNMMNSGTNLQLSGIIQIWKKYMEAKVRKDRITNKTHYEIIFRCWNKFTKNNNTGIKLIGEVPEIEV